MRGNATAKMKAIQAKQLVQRSQYLRAHSAFLSKAAFSQRKDYFCEKEKGAFNQKVDPSLNPQSQMMSDPSMLSDMLTKNLTMIVPQVGERVMRARGRLGGPLPAPRPPSNRLD